jgi:hypothetical protein
LLVLAVLLGPLVAASPAAAETSVEVETPVGPFVRSGVPSLLLVTVTADQAVTGTIDVTVEGEGLTTTSVDIEVPGGSAKTFAVPVSVSPWGGIPSVRVTTSDGTTKRPRVDLQTVGEVEPVAVMPSLVVPGLAERADMALELGQARLVPFDPANLEHGSVALNAASAVAAGEADLVNLSDEQRSALLAWVSTGGNLYIDGSLDSVESGAVGQAVIGTGTSFAPVSGGQDVLGRAWLGSGAIYAVGDTLSSGRYDGLITPRFSEISDEGAGFFDPGEVLGDLSADAGFRTRAIGPFMAVLLVYIALVGPLLWLFLSRSRREPLMWLAVPGLAVVVSVAIWGSGQFFRQGTSGSHVTVVGSSGTASRTVSDYMISSSNGGFTGVNLEPGWDPSASGTGQWDWRFQQAGFASPTLTGSRLGADVPPAGVVVLGVSSDETVASGWDVDLAVDGESIAGTVTNGTDHDLENVALFSGDQIVFVGNVASGASAQFELAEIGVPNIWDNQVDLRLANTGGRDSSASPAALGRWFATGGRELRTGQLTVVGWTKGADARLRTLGGDTVTRGRTGFASSVSVGAVDTSGQVSAATTRTRIVDLRWSEEFGGALAATDRRGQFEGEVQTLAYDTPPQADLTKPLVVEVPAGVSAMDIWNGRNWVDAGVGSAPPGDVLVRVPTQSVVGGTVYVRVMAEPPTPTPQLRSAGDDELDAALLVPGTVADADNNDEEGG